MIFWRWRWRRRRRLRWLTLAALALLVAGCRVENHGAKDDDVDIATPFGGLSVKTNDAAVQQGVGLAVYPGATLVKREKGDDSAADVNLSFGDFHLGVKALTHRMQRTRCWRSTAKTWPVTERSFNAMVTSPSETRCGRPKG